MLSHGWFRSKIQSKRWTSKVSRNSKETGLCQVEALQVKLKEQTSLVRSCEVDAWEPRHRKFVESQKVSDGEGGRERIW